MNSKRKVTMRTLLIISIVCAVLFLGAFIGFLFVLYGQADFFAQFKYAVKTSFGVYVYPFAKAHPYAQAFTSFWSLNGVDPLIPSIAGLALSGLAVLFIVLGTILAAAKKKPAYILYLFVLLGWGCLVGFSAGYGPYLYAALLNYIAKTAGYENVWLAVLSLLAMVFAAITFVLVLVNYFIGLKEICAKKQVVDEEAQFEAEQPVLAEEAVAPAEEQAEENEAVAASYANDYIPVVEPEPEPDPVETEYIAADEPELEPVEEAEPLPEPQPKPDETNNHVEVNVNIAAPANNAQPFDPNSLAALLRDVVRDIVRDEIARNNVNQPKVEPNKDGNQTVTGATFGGPLVVQYFNGGINGVTPTPAPAPVEEKKEEPAAEPEPEPEAEPEPEPAPAPVQNTSAVVNNEPAPAPVVEPQPEEEKVVYERLSFSERLLQSDKNILDLYNELKNEILSYGVKSRISAVGDTFRLHKKMYVRITVSGKSLKLYFALDPEDYANSKIPVQNAGHKGLYADIPLMFKVRSGLSVRRCKELIQDTMEKDGLEQGEIGKVNWVKELKAEMAAGKKKADEDDED